VARQLNNEFLECQECKQGKEVMLKMGVERRKKTLCKVESCQEFATVRGFCDKHYSHWNTGKLDRDNVKDRNGHLIGPFVATEEQWRGKNNREGKRNEG